MTAVAEPAPALAPWLRGILEQALVVVFAGCAPALALPPSAALVEVAAGEEVAASIRRSGPGRPCIVLDGLLQRGLDHRAVLAAAFDALPTGGLLVVVVPSQVLYERKLQPPSRLPTSYPKFYTPSLLLAEIEEAIDPFAFRLRFAGDHDAGYAGPHLGEPPQGRAEVLAAIEKVVPPPWLDRLAVEDAPVHRFTGPNERLRPGPDAPTLVIAPEPAGIDAILVLQLDHRGDFTMGEEARRLLRRSWPAADVTLVCGSWNAEAARAGGLADTVLAFDCFAEDISTGPLSATLDEQAARLRRLLGSRRFDLALDLRLHEDTRHLLAHVEARMKAGIDPGDAFPWLDIRLPAVDAERAARAWQRHLPASLFHSHARHDHFEIAVLPSDCAAAGADPLLWGGYTDLPMGDYEITVLARSEAATLVAYDLCAGYGAEVIAGGRIAIGAPGRGAIALHLPQAVAGLELRILGTPGRPYPPFAFAGLHIVKRASAVGLHQRESMALLVHLVALRCADPVRHHWFGADEARG